MQTSFITSKIFTLKLWISWFLDGGTEEAPSRNRLYTRRLIFLLILIYFYYILFILGLLILF